MSGVGAWWYRAYAEAVAAFAGPSTVGAPTESSSTTVRTSHTVSRPAGVAGRLTLVAFHCQVATTITPPSGYTLVPSSRNDTATHSIAWYTHVDDGSEGTTLTFTTSVGVTGAFLAWHITNAADPAAQAPQVTYGAAAATGSPDPPANTPTGGSKDYLWLAGFAGAADEADDDTWTVAAPTNYTGLAQKSVGAQGANAPGIAVAQRQLTASAENPGTFTLGRGFTAVPFTVAVHPPAAPVSHTGAAALTGTGSLTAAGTLTSKGAAALLGAGTLSGTGKRFGKGIAALTGTGALTATGKRAVVGAAALTGTGTLTATGNVSGKVFGEAALTATGTLSATGKRAAKGVAALTGAGSLGATGKVSGKGAAALTGIGSLLASSNRILLGSASLTGAGSLVVSGKVGKHGASVLVGLGTLGATGIVVVPPVVAPPPAEYRLDLCDLAGTVIRSDVMGVDYGMDLSYSYALNGPGAITFQLPSRKDGVTPANYAVMQRTLKLYRNEVLVWAGYLIGADGDRDVVTFSGLGWYEALRRRLIDTNHHFYQVEALEIAWSLIDYTQDKTDLGITRDPAEVASGKLRSRDYCCDDFTLVSEAIEDLAGMHDGFDFWVTPQKVWSTASPRRGIDRTATVVFNAAKNTTSMQASITGDNMATEVFYVGPNVDECRDLDSMTNGVATWGRHELGVDMTNIKSDTERDEYAAELLRYQSVPLSQVTCTCPQELGIVPLSFDLGDKTTVKSAEGWMTFEQTMRVIDFTVHVGLDCVEETTVQLDSVYT